MRDLIAKIIEIKTNADFEACAMEVFRYQYATNSIYKLFVDTLKVDVSEIQTSSKIPFLPISFFKSDRVICANQTEEIIFTSSGTTGLERSSHFVAALELYEMSYMSTFKRFYGSPDQYCILALLPSYSEREGSSLLYMVDDLIKKSKNQKSGHFLNADEKLKDTLIALELTQQKTILIGVTYALLDFAERFQLNLKHCLIMETGGMKGKRKELVREELHQILIKSLGVNTIHSEYGMTELLSQAYSKGNGLFYCPPWMRVEAREIDDPLSPALTQKTGGLNVIDLANLYSCSFISTHDLGKVYPDNSFEVLGRYDNSDIRGCNLLL